MCSGVIRLNRSTSSDWRPSAPFGLRHQAPLAFDELGLGRCGSAPRRDWPSDKKLIVAIAAGRAAGEAGGTALVCRVASRGLISAGLATVQSSLCWPMAASSRDVRETTSSSGGAEAKSGTAVSSCQPSHPERAASAPGDGKQGGGVVFVVGVFGNR